MVKKDTCFSAASNLWQRGRYTFWFGWLVSNTRWGERKHERRDHILFKYSANNFVSAINSNLVNNIPLSTSPKPQLPRCWWTWGPGLTTLGLGVRRRTENPAMPPFSARLRESSARTPPQLIYQDQGTTPPILFRAVASYQADPAMSSDLARAGFAPHTAVGTPTTHPALGRTSATESSEAEIKG